MKRFRLVIILMLLIPIAGTAQQKDTLIKKLDSLDRKRDSVGKQTNDINPSAYNQSTKITFKSYFIVLGSDLKQEFTKPFDMRQKDWWNFGKFTIVLIGAGFADEPIQKLAVRVMHNEPGLQKASTNISKFGGLYEAYTLATIGVYGTIFKKPKMITTTLLATQAYITGGALESVTKYLSGRTRPSYYNSNTEAEPKFLGPFAKTSRGVNGKKVYSSFPSGHTTVAFAAATVFASEYKDKIFVPILAYSAATLVGLSRITENKHWITDVLSGAAIGFLAGKNVVNNYHRYAKLKAPQQKKTTVALNIYYYNNQLMPYIIFKFK